MIHLLLLSLELLSHIARVLFGEHAVGSTGDTEVCGLGRRMPDRGAGYVVQELIVDGKSLEAGGSSGSEVTACDGTGGRNRGDSVAIGSWRHSAVGSWIFRNHDESMVLLEEGSEWGDLYGVESQSAHERRM